jgi:hypothetical protein
MLRVAAVVSLLAGLFAACADEGRGSRDTAGGGWRAACMTTNDCGCRDQRGTDDTFCEKDNSVQLQCLGGAKLCTLACQLDSDCIGLFGTMSRCSGEHVCAST